MEKRADTLSVYGHRKMIYWQNLDKLEILVQKEMLPCIPKFEFNLRDQIDRACSSSIANFIEGYYSGSLKEYLRFCGYSKRSLGELEERVRRIYRKGFIDIKIWQKFDELANKAMYMLNRLIDSLRQKSP